MTLFAVGVVTGTILSFEFGLLWPEFMARFGEVFGIGFALEGISFFVEAIFIAIYVYGWDRLSQRAHFLTGIPVVLSGFAGSFNVIAVNGWMNDPTGFDLGPNGEVLNPQPWSALLNSNMWHELIHMYLAGYLVCGFIVAGVYAYAWLQGRRDRYHRTALVVTLAFASLVAPVQVIVGDWAGREVAAAPAGQARGDGGAAAHADGRAVHARRLLRRGRGEVRFGIEVPRLLSLLAKHDPNATIDRARLGAAGGPPAGQHRPLRVPDDGRDRHRPRAARRRVHLDLVPQRRLPRVALVLPRGDGRRAAGVRRADRGLDHRPRSAASRGSSTRSCAPSRRSPQADGLEVGYVVLIARLRGAGRRRSSGCCAGSRASRRRPRWREWLRSAPRFVVLGIAAYAVLGSRRLRRRLLGPDRRRRRAAAGALRGMIQRSMAPVWEANHVWLIFVLVIVWTAFPMAFGSIFSTLYIPLFLAAIGIIFRGTAFALRGQAATINEARVLGALFASASVLIPFCFGAVLGGIASGPRRASATRPATRVDSWLNPTSALIGVIAVLTGAYLAAVYLAGDSVRAEQPDLARGVPRARAARGRGERRRRDRRPARPALRRARAVRRAHLRRRAGDGDRLRARGRRRRWRWCGPSATAWRASPSALAVVAIVVGWALAQNPYLLPPDLRSTRPPPPTPRCRRRSSSSRSAC